MMAGVQNNDRDAFGTITTLMMMTMVKMMMNDVPSRFQPICTVFLAPLRLVRFQ